MADDLPSEDEEMDEEEEEEVVKEEKKPEKKKKGKGEEQEVTKVENLNFLVKTMISCNFHPTFHLIFLS